MITTAMFIAVLLGTSLLSLKIVNRSGIRLNSVTVSGFFVVFYIVFAHLPMIILFTQIDAYRLNLGMTDLGIVMLMLAYSSTALLMVSCGIFFISRMPAFSAQPSDFRIEISLNTRSKLGLLIAVVFCITAIVLYAQKLSVVPILALLLDSGEDVKQARSIANFAFEGRRYLYATFFTGLAPFVCYASYAAFRFQGGILLAFLFLAALFVALGGAVITTSKGQLVTLILGLILTHIISGTGRVNFKTLFVGSTLILLPLMGIFYLVFFQGRDIGYVALSMFSRIFSEASSAYFYLENIPQKIDYLLGTNFPNPAGVFPWKPYPLTTTMQNILFPEMARVGLQGSMPSVFWAELHANWGYLGVVLIAPIVGLYTRFWDSVLACFPRTPLTAALVAWLAVHFARLVGKFFSAYIFDTYLIIVMVAFVTLTILNGSPLMQFRRRLEPQKSK